MKITIKQVLERGIAAHQQGKISKARSLYREILKVRPTHPDANYNLGILAVGESKVVEAISYFETAVEANPKIAQFWLSYIDALVKQKNFKKAKQVMKKPGISGWLTTT